jgi:hypothetical protein
VGQGDGVELGEDEVGHVVGGQPGDEDGVGHAALDVVVWGQRKRGQETGLGDEDEVVVLGKVLEEQAQAAQVVDLDEMGVVDDGREHLAGVVDAMGFLDEALLATDIPTVGVDLEGLAEDAQDAVIGVQGAVDDGGDEALGVVLDEGGLDDALAGAGLADDQAQAALLAVDTQGIEDLLLVGQQGWVVLGEGISLEAEVGADHGVVSLATGLRSLA